MHMVLNAFFAVLLLVAAGCTPSTLPGQVASVAPAGGPHGEIDGLIARYAAENDLPQTLVRRVVAHESNFDPGAHHRGNWGLMQIKAATARTMGYDGPAAGLLDADTNLKYGVRYLRGAYLVAGKDADRAIGYYRSGYYYRAKRMGLLEETGLRS